MRAPGALAKIYEVLQDAYDAFIKHVIDSAKADIQTRRPLSSVRPQAMSLYSLLDKPGLMHGQALI